MERFQNKRVWLGGGAASALLIIAVSWFMFISPELSSTDDLHAQAAATEQQNALLQLKVKTLEQKSTQLTKFTSSLQEALLSLPVDSGLPAFTRQLTAQAKASGVDLSSVTTGGIAPVVAAAAPTTATEPTTAASTATPTNATAPATTAAGGLFSIQVTLLSNGSLTHQLAFLNAIRADGPRRALITSTLVAPGAKAAEASIDATSSVTTQLTIFSAPQTPDQIAQLKALLSGKIGN